MRLWNEYRRIMENQRGAYLVLMVTILPLILIFTGLAVDLGRGYSHRAKLQNAADAAVMAAANIYFPDKDRDEVYEWAERYMNANRGDQTYKLDKITLRHLKDAASGDDSGGILLSVYASELVPVSFMAIAGFDAIPVDVVATAKIIPGEGKKDPGVWGYAFICGDGSDADHCGDDMDQGKEHIGKGAPFRVTDDGHRIIGKVHSNGAIGVTGSGTDFHTGTKYSLFVEPGDFSTSIETDSKLWKKSALSGWGHDWTGAPSKPWYANDQEINGDWHNFIRFGYYEQNPWGYIGTDVVAQKTYTENINISLSKTNSQTEAIYDYVEGLRKKYGSDYSNGQIFIKTDGNYGGDTRQDQEDFNSNGRKTFDTIIADGSIVVNDGQWLESADHLTIISLHGNVTLATKRPVKALIYAPNGQAYIIGGHGTADNPSFEGSVVAKYITLTTQHEGEVVYKWNDFGFGSGTGSGSSGSGSGDSSSTGSASSIIMYKDVDSNYGDETAI